MRQSTRILLNTVASYGRSLVGLACGIFTTRWVLGVLGDVDYGLYGLVGSLAIFVTFVSIQSSLAIARFYAYAVGQSQASDCTLQAVENCRVWFSIAVFVHVILAILLCGVGWPMGEYAVSHGWLDIPCDRVSESLWLWRFVCISCFASILSVPFQAMFTAKQCIVELTLYSLIQTVARTALVYYMYVTPRDWLVDYGLYMMIIGLFPLLLVSVRAVSVFPECRFVRCAFQELGRVRDLAVYAFWQSVGGFGYLAGHQIMAIVVNLAYGPRINASLGIAQTVAGEAGSLTGALQNAFSPAISTACGAQNMDCVRDMAYRVSKVGTLLTLCFALPLAIEIDEVLKVWLKDVPPNASSICICTLAFMVIEKLSCGHGIAVNATGKVGMYQCLHGILRITALPLAVIFVMLGAGVELTMTALPVSMIIVVIGDSVLAVRITGMSVTLWLNRIVLPIFAVMLVALAAGCISKFLLEPSLMRVVVTSVVTGAMLAVVSWKYVLSREERAYLYSMIRFIRR